MYQHTIERGSVKTDLTLVTRRHAKNHRARLKKNLATLAQEHHLSQETIFHKACGVDFFAGSKRCLRAQFSL